MHLPTLEIRVGQKRNRVKKERKMEEKKINASVFTNQVHLNIQFRHRFDQKCPFTDSLHRLVSRFARTSSVPLETKKRPGKNKEKFFFFHNSKDTVEKRHILCSLVFMVTLG